MGNIESKSVLGIIPRKDITEVRSYQSDSMVGRGYPRGARIVDGGYYLGNLL